MSLPFLLEIGTEEIPDWMIPPALESLLEGLHDVLIGITEGNVEIKQYGTPRRLAIRATPLLERQPDHEKLIAGPAKSAGPKAAEGFARKMGISVDELRIQATPKGEQYLFQKKEKGRATKDILAEVLPELIL